MENILYDLGCVSEREINVFNIPLTIPKSRPCIDLRKLQYPVQQGDLGDPENFCFIIMCLV